MSDKTLKAICGCKHCCGLGKYVERKCQFWDLRKASHQAAEAMRERAKRVCEEQLECGGDLLDALDAIRALPIEGGE